MLSKGDFHIHSTASDGELSPRDVIITAKSLGVDTIALADHNSTEGIGEAVLEGKKHGIAIIPAVELSTRYNGESIHLLGYFRDDSYNDPAFQEVLKYIKDHRVKKARSILINYMNIRSSGDSISVMEGIFFLKSFEAAVVLAHPVRINKKYLMEILNMPFDGIEAKYCLNTCTDTDYYINIALERFFFYSGGSDFHTNKSRDTKHCNIGQPFLDSEEIRVFLKKSGAMVYY